MANPADPRVAVYIDFDNIVISRYDQVHGRGRFTKDDVRGFDRRVAGADPEIVQRLTEATVRIGAIVDYASSFGTIALTRAYADWSARVNADYQEQLVGRAIDLVQLFPAAMYGKNGADIRLAVDAVEDLFNLPDLTHVVLVAGDSDYIALAQRAKRLGRYVVAVGVAGSTSRSLAAACDELITYDDLPGVRATRPSVGSTTTSAAKATVKKAPTSKTPTKKAAPKKASDTPLAAAGRLLDRALRLGLEKADADWVHSSSVKNQMKRLDPAFNEKTLGFRSFSEFVKALPKVAELDDSKQVHQIRLVAAQ